MIKTVSKIKKLNGEITIPADKSVSHRAVMLSSIAKGRSVIKNFSNGADCHSTVNLFKQLGISINFIDEKRSDSFSVWYSGFRDCRVYDYGNFALCGRRLRSI